MVKFARDIEAQVTATIQRMVAEGLNVCELPDGGGLMLVRLGSVECQQRRDDHTIVMVPAPKTDDASQFFVCSS